jgi:preprotein translocase subunit SecF
LAIQGHQVSPTVVGALLRKLGYSLQANSKIKEWTYPVSVDS